MRRRDARGFLETRRHSFAVGLVAQQIASRRPGLGRTERIAYSPFPEPSEAGERGGPQLGAKKTGCWANTSRENSEYRHPFRRGIHFNQADGRSLTPICTASFRQTLCNECSRSEQ